MEQQAAAPKNSNPKAKHWCITINNYGVEDLASFVVQRANIVYYVVGKEVGKEGTPHLQCYIAWKSQKTLATLKKIWPKGHFEITRGTPEEAAQYCKKDEDFEEFGEIPPPRYANGADATKAKWVDIKDKAKSGDLDEIDPKIFVTHYRTLKQISYDFQEEVVDLDGVCGEWIWGEPGVGKSRAAREENPSLYQKMPNKWWDNYNGEEAVLIDDFSMEHNVLGHHLKIWADRYAFRGEVKNFSKMLRPKKIIVTSNYSISQIWSDPVLVEALSRRFKIRHMVSLKATCVNIPDIREPPKKKQKKHDEPFIKKRPLLRQNANGNLVPIISDAQPRIDQCILDAVDDILSDDDAVIIEKK